MAVDACSPAVMIGRFSAFFVWLFRYFPPSILKLLAPSLKGLMVLRGVSRNGCDHTVQNIDPH